MTGELVSRDSDFGIAAATGGQAIGHLVKAHPDMPPATDKVSPVTLWK